MVIRIEYEKVGDIAYISHLEVIKLMERIARRAKIRVLYSQGFSPHPKASFSPALSVGTYSLCEYIDLELEDEDIELDILLEKYNEASVDGIRFKKARKMPKDTKSIASFITHSKYEFFIDEDIDFSDIKNVIDFIVKSDIVSVQRKSKSNNLIEYNLKDYIEEIYILDNKIYCTIATSSAKNLNPKNLLNYILEKANLKIEDVCVIIKKLDTFHLSENGEELRAI